MEPDVVLFLLLVVIILIAITVFGVLSYSGLFAFPRVRTGPPPINYNCTFAYQYLRGGYSSNNVGAAFTMVTSIAPKTTAVGVFYDDPKVVPEDQLRCAVGCLIDREEAVAKADASEAVDDGSENVITRPFIDEREEELLKKKGFHFCKLPAVDLAVVTQFPYTTPFSIWLAPGKVYPRLCSYISSKGLCAYPFIEVYSDNLIRFMAPLSKQEDFYVPEAKEDSERQSSNPTSSCASSGNTSPEIVERNAGDEQAGTGPVDGDGTTNVRHRKQAQSSDEAAQRAGNPENPSENEECKRKDSSQSSTGSSFEELAIEEIK